jgi:hypothetical protein
MSGLKFQINVQIKNVKSFDIGTFAIPLAFACLPQAGILTFGLHFRR